MDWAALVMGAWEIADAHQELVDDLASCEAKYFLENLDPLVLRLGVMQLKPSFEGAVLLLQKQDRLRIRDGCVDFQSVANDTRIREQPSAIDVSVSSDLLHFEVAVGLAEGLLLLQDRLPAQTRLVDL